MRSALFFSFLLGVAALPAQNRELGVAVPTTLSAVRAEPEAFQNVKVVFTVQFASLGRISNPFFTKFTPSDYANFYAWGDEQQIWQQKNYDDVFGMLFLSKLNRQLDELYSTRLYQRLRLTAVIRNTFQDIPWIEVMEFEVLDEQLDTAVLTHLHRGEKLMQQRLWQRAIAELQRVPGEGVPPHAMRAAHKDLGTCLLRMGEAEAAIGYLESAAAGAELPDAEVEQLLTIARTQPGEALDRTVDVRSLTDSERPMWEAFDNGAVAQPTTRVLRR